ncbi:MAG: hypothetical protein RSA22_11785 [Acinetobacter sp.]
MSSAIKFFTNTNNNMPQLQNAYGSMINVLDACLVNGITIGAINSLTASGTTVTAVFSAAHNLMKHQVITLTGADQAEYNIESRVLSVPNATTITFQLNVAPSVSPATGAISAKLSALDWEKPFSSINGSGGGKAAYRSSNTLLASRPYLRVVDELDPAYTATYAKYAKVGIVEDMTDINTMLGVQAPYNSSTPNQNWVGTGSGTSAVNGWSKWYYAGQSENYFPESSAVPAGNRNWILVGNGDYFYVFVSLIASNTNLIPYGFGSFKTLLNADTSNTFLSSTLTTAAQTAATGVFHADSVPLGTNSTTTKLTVLRNYAQTAQYVQATMVSMTVNITTMYSGYQNYIGAYNLANVAPFVPIFVNETVLRGEMNGFYWLYQNRPYTHLQIIERENVAYMAINIAMSTSNPGQVVVKIGDI